MAQARQMHSAGMRIMRPFALSVACFAISISVRTQPVIRVNQLGYLPKTSKVAVLLSKDSTIHCRSFVVRHALSRTVARVLPASAASPPYAGFAKAYRLDFSSITSPGGYFLEAAGARSPLFRIDDDVYDGTADFLLRYMRQQRSGYNPFLHDSCHTKDGFVLYDPPRDSSFVDVSGGWHDAADYLQYVTTSATATYQMLFAYRKYPGAFGDGHRENGEPGPNGIPDILDEASWGLAWLAKMNPRRDEMYHQIADDRDHRGFRLPTLDSTDYGFGRGRPVYRSTGLPQGLMNYRNRSTGLASIAGKFSSAFALGAEVFATRDPVRARVLAGKALDAFRTGLAAPGVCQTAPCRAPYFYEEDNWKDDMELAAVTLRDLTGNPSYLDAAVSFGRDEGVSPWMNDNTARHYQWYPFVNIGHALVARGIGGNRNEEFVGILRSGIEAVARRGAGTPFLFGIPFVWCSNNYVSAFVTDLLLYREVSGDRRYERLEAAMRDWLFGCNPWGTSMVVGLPEGGVSPRDPHSAFSHVHGFRVDGGLVDGPVKGEVFASLKGVSLSKEDPFRESQSTLAVYHDDWADYATNEPTMDGTAGLTIPLASYGRGAVARRGHVTTEHEGGVVRMDSTRRTVYLLFSGHEFADGGTTILRALRNTGVKGSFFFTGAFYRTPAFRGLIRRLRAGGHYLGAHSDAHLLYADWTKRDSLLVGHDQFVEDLRANYAAMAEHGISAPQAKAFLPPYEWYNRAVSDWCRSLGLSIVNYTPGTRSNADYTVPSMPGYMSSAKILDQIRRIHASRPSGLNGVLLLLHVGTAPERTDKLYDHLEGLIRELQGLGYSFGRL
jgi:peptidoglycan/xylan/chitin deacetylase (PgdA/CDA1 family)